METKTEKRIGERDRDKTVQYLRDCYAGGYLDEAEMRERISAAVSAKFRRELTAVTGDMPSAEELTGAETEVKVAGRVTWRRLRQIRSAVGSIRGSWGCRG